jgi:hypothetical protein
MPDAHFVHLGPRPIRTEDRKNGGIRFTRPKPPPRSFRAWHHEHKQVVARQNRDGRARLWRC